MLWRCAPRQGTLFTRVLSRPRSKWVPGIGHWRLVCLNSSRAENGSRAVCFPGSWDGLWTNRSCNQGVIVWSQANGASREIPDYKPALLPLHDGAPKQITCTDDEDKRTSPSCLGIAYSCSLGVEKACLQISWFWGMVCQKFYDLGTFWCMLGYIFVYVYCTRNILRVYFNVPFFQQSRSFSKNADVVSVSTPLVYRPDSV